MARKKKVRPLHRDPLVRRVAVILEAGRSSLWQYEAACRTGIRSRLCLSGTNWHDADDYAGRVVLFALHRIGRAHRPSWAQGQPEYDDRLIERRRCVTCGGEMELGSRLKYCSDECGAIAWNRQWQARGRHEDEITRLAFHAACAKGERPERQCAHCDKAFEVTAKNVRQKYCDEKCFKAAKSVDKNRMCPTCGIGFIANHRTHEYCSPHCQSRARKVELPTKKCETCGVEFQPRDRWQNERRRFCSRACSDEAQRARWKCEAAA